MNTNFPGSLSVGILILTAGPALGQGSPSAQATPSVPAHAVPFPHPLITEVLFNVPSGPKGDANGDGTRDAVGEEFVELINPHDKPIQLKGYVLSDSSGWPGKRPAEAAQPPANGSETVISKPGAKNGDAPPKDGGKEAGQGRGSVKFVFPELTLKPGERVVVFNGLKQKFSGPVGDSARAPSATNPAMGDAFVFTIRNDSKFNSFSNTGDWVGLSSPSGEAIEVLAWGNPSTPPPSAIVREEVEASAGSMQRTSIDGDFVRHQDLPGDASGKFFSPGVFAWDLKSGAPAGRHQPGAPTPGPTPTTPK